MAGFGAIHRNRIWANLANEIWPNDNARQPILSGRPEEDAEIPCNNGVVSHRLYLKDIEQLRTADDGENAYPKPTLLLEVAKPSQQILTNFYAALEKLVKENRIGSIVITTSARTYESDADLDLFFSSVKELISKQSYNIPYFQYDYKAQSIKTSKSENINLVGKPHNPYPRMLANADLVFILGASRSMASEAALTGVPIY